LVSALGQVLADIISSGALPVVRLTEVFRQAAQEHGQHKLLARSNDMSRLSFLLIVCAALSAGTGLAHAGTCADQITQLRQAARLDHDPTPESVRQVQTYAQLMFAAALAEAEALDAEGNDAECLLAARRAKQMIEPG
jgi:hypothetical protein